MEIQKERFEAWLFGQPETREFDYMACSECAIASFVKETTRNRMVTVGGDDFSPTGRLSDRSPIPDWLRNLLSASLGHGHGKGWTFTISDLQREWRKMFPEVSDSSIKEICETVGTIVALICMWSFMLGRWPWQRGDDE